MQKYHKKYDNVHYINKNYVLKPINNDEKECINDTLSPLPPLHHLTLHNCYLQIPRETYTTKMVVEGMVEGMIASHSLHVSIVDRIIITLTVVGSNLTSLIGLLLPLHHRV